MEEKKGILLLWIWRGCIKTGRPENMQLSMPWGEGERETANTLPGNMYVLHAGSACGN